MSDEKVIKWTVTKLDPVLPTREGERKSVGNRVPHRTMMPTSMTTQLPVGRTISQFAPPAKHPKSCSCMTCEKGPRNTNFDGDIQRLRDDRIARRVAKNRK